MKTGKRKKPKADENGKAEAKVFSIELRTMRVADLKEAPYNPRKWTSDAFARLRYSIRTLGVFQPPLYNARTHRIVAGHMRVKAAEAEGFSEIPVLVTEDYTADEEQRANLQSNNRASQGRFTRRAIPLVAAIQKLDREAYTQLGLDGIAAQIEEDESGGAGGGKVEGGQDEKVKTLMLKMGESKYLVWLRARDRAKEMNRADNVLEDNVSAFERICAEFITANGEPEAPVEEEKERPRKRRKP